MDEKLLFLLTGIAGFIFHSLLKLKSLNDAANDASVHFDIYRDYILKDRWGIIAAFLSPFIWLILFGEMAAKYPSIKEFALTSFFVMGALGSYILQLILGRAKRQIRNVVNDKTNELQAIKKETQLTNDSQ